MSNDLGHIDGMLSMVDFVLRGLDDLVHACIVDEDDIVAFLDGGE